MESLEKIKASLIDPEVKIHSHALVEENVRIGAKTRVWAFAHILPGVIIGSECNICDHTFIETGVILGNRVTIKCGVYLWTGVEIEDDVFVGPCVSFTNDKRPRSMQYSLDYDRTYLLQGCSIGANATLLPGITIGRWSMVGAGSVVTRDVPAHALVFGNPAKIMGWVCECGERLIANKFPQSYKCVCGNQYHNNNDQKQLERIE
ncbi:MAG: acyltransferase [Gammaproteobacteria bacterium]